MRILVVEDDHLLNSTLCYNLSAGGYKVDSANTKAEAAKYCEEQAYELAPEMVPPTRDLSPLVTN